MQNASARVPETSLAWSQLSCKVHLLMWQKTALLGYTSDAKYICWCARNQLYLITAQMQNASVSVPGTSLAGSQL